MRHALKKILAALLCVAMLFSALTVMALPGGAAVTAGDINGDGSVNNKDLTRLFQFLSEWEVKIYPQSICEHNGGIEIRNAVEPTCVNDGYSGDTYCLICDEKIADGETVPATGLHSGGTATCHTLAVCSVCGAEYGEYNFDNHNGATEVVGACPAACIDNGYTGDTRCLGCGNIILTGESIKAHGHNYIGAVTLASCTKAGYTTYTCSYCGDSYVGSYVNALGHTGGTATCHTLAVCSTCGEEYGEYDALNHTGGTQIAGAVAPSGAEYGYTGDEICLGCGGVIVAGHYYDSAHTHTGGNATYYQKGVCDICWREYYAQMYTYDCLTDTQKQLYDVIKNSVVNLEKKSIYLFEYLDDPETGESDINVVIRAISYDHPEYFWMPRSFSVEKTTVQSTGVITDISLSFADSHDPARGQYHVTAAEKVAMQAQLEARINEIIALASQYDTDFEKEVFLHDYLCENIVYNTAAANDPTVDYFSFTAYGALINGTCVCEGYSRAMQLLCQRLGIPCGLVTGQFASWNTETEDVVYTLHMWNIINPGDGCYYLDITFDDLDEDAYPKLCTHYCFNITTEETALDHIFDEQYDRQGDYSDSSLEYNFFDTHGDRSAMNYYLKRGAYITTDNLEQVAAYINDLKNSGVEIADFLYDDENITPTDAMKAINRILTNDYGFEYRLPYGYGYYENWMFVLLVTPEE
ncbi:MAG: hypothetical protein IK086_00755 [Clostridia bacterium]|nr:hypothetical protein [Clostridia bacterium]